MRRALALLLCSAAAALLGLLPWRSQDAAALIPVQTLLLDVEGHQVVLRAEGGLEGRGRTLEEAMTQMAEQAPGVLFFGQTARVICGQDAAGLLLRAGIESRLRLSTAVYRVRGRAGALAPRVTELEPYWQERGWRLRVFFCRRPFIIHSQARPSWVSRQERTWV